MAPEEPTQGTQVTPETAAALTFDPDEVLGAVRAQGARRTPEDRERAALAIDGARFEAAEFLVDGGSPADARLAARWLLGRAA